MKEDAVRAKLSQQFVEDQQGFLAAEARLILRGKLRGTLTDEHREALVAENREIVGLEVDQDAKPF